MFPPSRLQWLQTDGGSQKDLWRPWAGADDAPDSGYGNAGYRAWNFDRGAGGEEQFVVFSACEGLVERGARRDGQGGGVNFSCDLRLFADMGQIGGKAIADVESG